MNLTSRLALEAKEKAESMGWEVRIQLDQSDVIDMATVVAWAPGSAQDVRFIRFIEGEEAWRGSRKHSQVNDLLAYHLCYC